MSLIPSLSKRGLMFPKGFRFKTMARSISNAELSKCIVDQINIHNLPNHFRSREKPLFFFNDKELQLFKKILPQSMGDIVSDADEICAHSFDLLSFGKTNLNTQSGKIDWHIDFKSGMRWDSTIPYLDTKIIKGNGSDIKVPWELSRFQHLPTLGKAYYLTGDEKYAKEFVEEIDDWIESNPPLYGVNWTSTMDVAIRAVNWIWGYHFFKEAPAVTDEFLLNFLKSFLIHGRHIMANLERSSRLRTFASALFQGKLVLSVLSPKWRGINGNHYLSDIVGLVYLGTMFPEFKEAKEWREFGIQELVSEMKKQVCDDGTDFEASTSYHRLVTELFLSATLICLKNGISFPAWYMERLQKMFDYTLHYIKPDGMAPQIGDNDNGRLHTFKDRDVLGHSYLLSTGAVLFQDREFKVKEFGFDEETLYLCGIDGYNSYAKLPFRNKPILSKAFVNGGVYIMRNDIDYMIISCGPNGQGGNGGHAHNDKLSFELSVQGEDFIVDPGTYSYTGEPKWRNRFRSTSYHNSVSVDGEEQNRFDNNNLFSMYNDSKPRCIKWESNEDSDLLIGEHYGFTRLPDPVIHRREIRFNKSNRVWGIKDAIYRHNSVKASNDKQDHNHTIEWYFQLSPFVEILSKGNSFVLSSKNTRLRFFGNGDYSLSCDVIKGWYSPGYGVKKETKVIKYTYIGEIPFECEFKIECVGEAA